jgi:hypothetical protein
MSDIANLTVQAVCELKQSFTIEHHSDGRTTVCRKWKKERPKLNVQHKARNQCWHYWTQFSDQYRCSFCHAYITK